MEQNKENGSPADRNQVSGGCSCGCGGGKKSVNLIVIAIWVVVTLGFACFVAYSRHNANKNLTEGDKLLIQAMDLLQKDELEAGVDCMKRSAELGNAWAQMYYGGSLKKGIGSEQDMAAAVEWYRKSAEQGCAVAFYELGVCYENGEGVERNLDESLAWYRKALDGGIKEAESAIIRVEKAKALESSPEAKAQNLMEQAQALFDQQGRDVECAELLRQAAELGNALAQVSYGRFLCKGIGTALDPAEAVEWFRKAADQNCPAAFYELGVCYENGEGVEKNLAEAEAWYRKAVDGGFEGMAKRSLDRVVEERAKPKP